MANDYFKFKQFEIHQNNCAMKVGTDGVLLGAWCDVDTDENILDIGSGTGLISLMIAQRAQNALITALEIDKDAFLQSKENVVATIWQNRIECINMDFIEFAENKQEIYDHIVSNPPYFENSLKSSNLVRTLARHTETLAFEDLIRFSYKLLKKNGSLSLITPSDAEAKIDELAKSCNLICKRKTYVRGNENSSVKRVLSEYIKSDEKHTLCLDELIIEKQRNVYTQEYINLTKEFYLKM